MDDDDDLKTLGEVIAGLEELPELAPGRLWLNAIKAIHARELEIDMLDGPEDYASLVWESMITVGALSDGQPRFHAYPSGSATDDLAARDAACAVIMALSPPAGDVQDLVRTAARKPGATFAVLVRAHADAPDGPMVTELLHHPDVARRDAVGWLKLAVGFLRAQESEGTGNN
jgi:hypothetical protein